ncbi:MAG TPA: tetratricopeptide repeat protein [bacterium]|nr:tetratricopeptide repeat protein [bacterium]
MKQNFFVILLLVIFISILYSQNINEQNSRTHYKLGISYFEKKDYRNAIVSFEEAIKFDPSNANAYYSLGTVYLAIGNYVEAIKNLELSIQYNPNIADAFYNLGICYYKTRQYNKAVNAFKSAIALNQNDIDYHINLGVVYRILGKYPEAIVEYQKALLLNPTSIPALLNLGVAYKLNGEIDKAIEQYNKVLKIDENNKEALYNLSIIKRDYDLQRRSELAVYSPEKSETTKLQPLPEASMPETAITKTQEKKEETPYTEQTKQSMSSVYYSTQESFINLKDEFNFTRKIVEELKSDMQKLKDDYSKFKEGILQRIDELRKSAADEIKNISTKADKTIKEQQEQYLLSLEEFRKEMEDVKKAKKMNELELKNTELNKEVAQLSLKLVEVKKNNRALEEKLNAEKKTFELESVKALKEELRTINSELGKIKEELNKPKTSYDMSSRYQSDYYSTIYPSYQSSYYETPRYEEQRDYLVLQSILSQPSYFETPRTTGTTPQYTPSVSSASSLAGKININTASLSDLTRLPNITEYKAQNIIWYRENIEKFKTGDDIIKVPGITLEDYNALKDVISVF